MTLPNDSPEAWVAIPGPRERAARSGPQDPYNFGFVPAMGGLISSHPDIGPPFMALYGALMFAPARALDRAERELVAAVTAAAQDCTY
ncbi:MAG: hypothetical protein AB7V59_07060 [Gammaproteobacteria bacterium]